MHFKGFGTDGKEFRNRYSFDVDALGLSGFEEGGTPEVLDMARENGLPEILRGEMERILRGIADDCSPEIFSSSSLEESESVSAGGFEKISAEQSENQQSPEDASVMNDASPMCSSPAFHNKKISAVDSFGAGKSSSEGASDLLLKEDRRQIRSLKHKVNEFNTDNEVCSFHDWDQYKATQAQTKAEIHRLQREKEISEKQKKEEMLRSKRMIYHETSRKMKRNLSLAHIVGVGIFWGVILTVSVLWMSAITMDSKNRVSLQKVGNDNNDMDQGQEQEGQVCQAGGAKNRSTDGNGLQLANNSADSTNIITALYTSLTRSSSSLLAGSSSDNLGAGVHAVVSVDHQSSSNSEFGTMTSTSIMEGHIYGVLISQVVAKMTTFDVVDRFSFFALVFIKLSCGVIVWLTLNLFQMKSFNSESGTIMIFVTILAVILFYGEVMLIKIFAKVNTLSYFSAGSSASEDEQAASFVADLKKGSLYIWRKYFAINHHGLYAGEFLLAEDIIEIILQLVSLNDLSRTQDVNDITPYIVIIGMNCFTTALVMWIHSEKTVYLTAFNDILFDVAFLVVNIQLRLNDDTALSPNDIGFICLPLFCMYYKSSCVIAGRAVALVLTKFLRTWRVFLRDQEEAGLATPKCLASITMVAQTSLEKHEVEKKFALHKSLSLNSDLAPWSSEENHNLVMNIIHNQRVFSSLEEEEEWKKGFGGVGGKNESQSSKSNFRTGKRFTYLRKILSAMLFFIGVGVMFLYLKITSRAEICRDLYGECVWKGVSPQIFFTEGVLGETNCGEEFFVEIKAAHCGLRSLPSPLTLRNDPDRKNANNKDLPSTTEFKKLQHIDLRYNLLEFLSPMFFSKSNFPVLQSRNLQLQGNPVSQDLDWNDQNLHRLPVEFLENDVTQSLQHLNLGGNKFTSTFSLFADFRKHNFKNLISLDLSGNILEDIDGFNCFLEEKNLIKGGSFDQQEYFSLDVSRNRLFLDATTGLSHRQCHQDNERDVGTSETPEAIEISTSSLPSNPKSSSTTHELIDSATHLKFLNISNNKIDNLPLDFAVFLRDVDMDIHQNQIKEISVHGQQCRRLLKNGRLPTWFDQLGDSLKNFTATYCSIREVDLTFLQSVSPTIERLNFSRNVVENVGGGHFAIVNFPRLVDLDCSKNRLQGTLSDIFVASTKTNQTETRENVETRSTPPFPFLQKLHLDKNELHGPLIEDVPLEQLFPRLEILEIADNNLQGNISQHVFNHMKHLKTLNLARNYFGGTMSEQIFHNLTQLQVLDLEKNVFTGSLPENLFLNQYNLQVLNFQDNNFQGKFPEKIFQNLAQLRILLLQKNDFEGELRENIFQALKQLEILNLQQNNLASALSETLFGNVQQLRELRLQWNRFSGPLPEKIFSKLHKLKVLQIQKNKLEGELFENMFQNLTNLEVLELDTQMSMGGLDGELSEKLFTANSQLKILRLRENNFWGKLGEHIFSNLKRLKILDVSYNVLEDSLSEKLFENLEHLEMLNIQRNDFRGPLPGNIFSKLSQLHLLSIGYNYLDGLLPENIFGNLTNLRILYFHDNQFSGSLAEKIFQNQTKLNTMEMYGNGFSGPLPEKIFHSLHKLLYLTLYSNFFDGHLPENLFAYTPVLHNLYLDRNCFCGSLPEKIFSHTPKLTTLMLYENQFEGDLPEKIFSHTPKLTVLAFSQNEFEGDLPENIFVNLPNLRVLYFNSNRFGPSLPKNVFSAQSKLLGLDLHGNSFEGELPNFSNLVRLQQLDFRYNRFTSLLPSTFRTMTGVGMGILPSPLQYLWTNQPHEGSHDSQSSTLKLNWGGHSGGLFDIWVPNGGSGETRTSETSAADHDENTMSYVMMNATQLVALKNTQNVMVDPESPGNWLSPKDYNLQPQEVSLQKFATHLHFSFGDHPSVPEKCQQLGFPDVPPACEALCVADCPSAGAVCVGFTDLARVGDGICDNGITNELVDEKDEFPPNFNCHVFDDDRGDCSDSDDCISDCDGK